MSPLYTSMAQPTDYSFMLKVSFASALALYMAMAVLGLAVFGPDVRLGRCLLVAQMLLCSAARCQPIWACLPLVLSLAPYACALKISDPDMC